MRTIKPDTPQTIIANELEASLRRLETASKWAKLHSLPITTRLGYIKTQIECIVKELKGTKDELL